MTSRELWQSVLDKTNKEIETGEYCIEFSTFEVYHFPRPTPFQKWTYKFLTPIYLKLKDLSKQHLSGFFSPSKRNTKALAQQV